MKMRWFMIFLVAGSVIAQRPLRTTGIEIYDRPNSDVRRQLLSSGNYQSYNVIGGSRVLVSSSTGTTGSVGIVRGFTGAAGAETTVWSADLDGVSTTAELRVIDNVVGNRIRLGTASSNFYNSIGASRILISTSSGTTGSVGIVGGYTGAAGLEVQAWRADTAGFSTYGDTRGYTFTNAAGSLIGTWRADTNGGLLQMDYDASGTLKSRAVVSATPSTGLFDSYSDVLVSGVLTPTLTARIGGGVVQGITMAFGDKIIGPSFYRAFTVPSSGTASITWTLPTTDASGCLQSNGSGTLSISACPGGGVTSVSGSGAISSTGGSTPVISCPTCVLTNVNQTITASHTIEDATLTFDTNGAFGGFTTIGGGSVSLLTTGSAGRVSLSNNPFNINGTGGTVSIFNGSIPIGEMTPSGFASYNGAGVLTTFMSQSGLFTGGLTGFSPTGRGVSVSSGGTVTIRNTSGGGALVMTSVGLGGRIDVMDGSGTLNNGLTLTCGAGNYLFQPTFVGGVLVGGSCSI